ncbi:type VI secretion system amidase effector protein Tae4, partial [Chryseobacterium echinoideorum]|uniref:type VI secretion system amidase effector protein Tae4 n=1 Tax=Chryseobacterium echinoideorum TaxID=1549648 RepID=UPI0011851FE4
VTAREDAECTTYLITGPCSCHETHAAGGCTHPIQIMLTQCGTGSGSGTVTSGSTYYTGTPTASFPSNSSGAYVYGTADQIYNSLRIKLRPEYTLTSIQKFKILESPDLASQIITFLNQNPQHKAAAVSFINSIGPISTAQEMQTAISNYINGFNFNSGLSSAQNTWKAQNPALFDKILAYILLDYPNRKDFGYWGINFLIQNPTTTSEQFKNWFMGESEGNDGGVEFNIDDYNGIQVQTHTSLPGRNAFYNAFPKDGTVGMQNTAVYQLIGGNLYNLHQTYPSTYWNACAIRVSRALNYSGHSVPVFKNKFGQQRTEKGADGKNYILDAASMLAYMLKAYPNNPPLHLENKTQEEYLQALKGKWGIYIMLPKPNVNFGATGHADFFSYSGCLSHCYFQNAKEIYFWELN